MGRGGDLSFSCLKTGLKRASAGPSQVWSLEKKKTLCVQRIFLKQVPQPCVHGAMAGGACEVHTRASGSKNTDCGISLSLSLSHSLSISLLETTPGQVAG